MKDFQPFFIKKHTRRYKKTMNTIQTLIQFSRNSNISRNVSISKGDFQFFSIISTSLPQNIFATDEKCSRKLGRSKNHICSELNGAIGAHQVRPEGETEARASEVCKRKSCLINILNNLNKIVQDFPVFLQPSELIIANLFGKFQLYRRSNRIQCTICPNINLSEN